MAIIILRPSPVEPTPELRECGTDPAKLAELVRSKFEPVVLAGLPRQAEFFAIARGKAWCIGIPYGLDFDRESAEAAVREFLVRRKASAAVFVGVVTRKLDKCASLLVYAENRRGQAWARLMTPVLGEDGKVRGWTEPLNLDAKDCKPFAFFERKST